MTEVELLGVLLAVFGIAISVYFGIKALGARQVQKTKSNSISIQSGRDSKINDKN